METVESPSDVVSISSGAKALKLSPTTVSHLVRDGVVPNRGTARNPKISVSEARKARADSMASTRRTNGRPAVPVTPGTLNAHRTAHEKTKSEKAALELAQMQRELLARGDVEDCFATAARELRARMTRRWRTLAVELEGLSSREIEKLGLMADGDLLRLVADEFERWSADAGAA